MALRDDVTAAYRKTFLNALEDPKRLVAIHRQLAEGRGRRSPELLSLNRSAVVLAIAAWQAYVEALAQSLLGALGAPSSHSTADRTVAVMWSARRRELEREIAFYSTANADKTANLLDGVGFAPKSHWTWGAGAGHLSPNQVSDRLNQWVRVRNAIAHGGALPAVSVITKNKSGPTVRLKDAESCIDFVEKLARETDTAARRYAERAVAADARVESDQIDTDYLLGAVEDLLMTHDL